MKNLIKFLLIALLVGDCVVITKGLFKNSLWTVIGVNRDGTYDIEYDGTIIREVRGSYLERTETDQCK